GGAGLDQLVESSADLDWMRVSVGYRMVEALLAPGVGEAVVAEARKQAARLSKPGREQFARLARLLGDAAAAGELAPSGGSLPFDLGNVISVRLWGAGRYLLTARGVEATRRAKRAATALEYAWLAQNWLWVHRPEEGLLAAEAALKRAPDERTARVAKVDSLMAGRQFPEGRKAIDDLLAADKKLP